MGEMADVLVVLIVFTALFGGGTMARILRHREKMHQLKISQMEAESKEDRVALTQQVEALTQRVEVLEAIVTDSKYQLEQQMASLSS